MVVFRKTALMRYVDHWVILMIVLVLTVIYCFIWQKSRVGKKFSSSIDHAEKGIEWVQTKIHALLQRKQLPKLKLPHFSFKLPIKKPSETTKTISPTQVLVSLLNEKQPATRDEIKEHFAIVFGKNIIGLPLIEPNPLNKDLWVIQFNLSSGHVKIEEIEKGVWVEKKKESKEKLITS
jgi:hypothetical protein